MPSAVSDQGPRVFFRECSGSAESLISLSIDLRASSWLGSALLLVAELPEKLLNFQKIEWSWKPEWNWISPRNSAGVPCALLSRNPVFGLQRNANASTGRAPTSSPSSSSRHGPWSAGPSVRPSCGLRVLPSCVLPCLQSWMCLPRITSFAAIASMIPCMRADVCSIVTGILVAGKPRIERNCVSNRCSQLERPYLVSSWSTPAPQLFDRSSRHHSLGPPVVSPARIRTSDPKRW